MQGRLSDLGHGLAELQRRVYDDKARETLEEIVPHPVSYEPFKEAKFLLEESKRLFGQPKPQLALKTQKASSRKFR